MYPRKGMKVFGCGALTKQILQILFLLTQTRTSANEITQVPTTFLFVNNCWLNILQSAHENSSNEASYLLPKINVEPFDILCLLKKYWGLVTRHSTGCGLPAIRTMKCEDWMHSDVYNLQWSSILVFRLQFSMIGSGKVISNSITN